ncbi:hypothetical protein GLOTRDRAFT_14166, partial [Gloeophyllum trabeum ATCC 11539]
MDQQGKTVTGGTNQTFHDIGAKQVDIIAKDEKRAYTLAITSTASGKFLPMQQIWGGTTPRVLPDRDADGMDEAIRYGFDFTFAQGGKKGSHFSTFKTMKEWMKNIYAPYVKRTIEEDPDLDEDQKSILL